MWLIAAVADAQVSLPEVGVRLPEVALPGPAVEVRTPAVAARLDSRRLQVRNRLRAHPERLALDPRGELIVRGELLAEPADERALAAVLAAGFAVLRHRQVAALDLDYVVLQPPAGWSPADSLRRLRKLDPHGRYDFHHVLAGGGNAEPATAQYAAAALPVTTAPVAVRVGLVDGGVATLHAAFAGAEVLAHGCGGRNVPSVHGTAVASLLVETLNSRSREPPAHVQLLAADAYCGDAAGGAIERVIESLGWLVERRVPVINVSLVGPPNRLLERAVTRVLERGHVLVAAVGNDGPAAPPLYPAAYEGVIAVTAVDRRGRVLVEACRGPHVAFAALGADLQAAVLPEGRGDVRGTSYAAPQVAAMLALQIPQVHATFVPAAVQALAAGATDLGSRGRDAVYGFGLVAMPPTTSTPPLMSKERN